MISVAIAEQVHHLLIEHFGGSSGIRNIESLQSALSRPFQTFEGKLLYPTVFEKAAALLESIVVNHPFVDGNKRTGYVLARLLLMANNYDIEASEDEKYQLVIALASGQRNFRDLVYWFEHNCREQDIQ